MQEFIKGSEGIDVLLREVARRRAFGLGLPE